MATMREHGTQLHGNALRVEFPTGYKVKYDLKPWYRPLHSVFARMRLVFDSYKWDSIARVYKNATLPC